MFLTDIIHYKLDKHRFYTVSLIFHRKTPKIIDGRIEYQKISHIRLKNSNEIDQLYHDLRYGFCYRCGHINNCLSKVTYGK